VLFRLRIHIPGRGVLLLRAKSGHLSNPGSKFNNINMPAETKMVVKAFRAALNVRAIPNWAKSSGKNQSGDDDRSEKAGSLFKQHRAGIPTQSRRTLFVSVWLVPSA
jgi:hypothetical protein